MTFKYATYSDIALHMLNAKTEIKTCLNLFAGQERNMNIHKL